MIFRLAISLLAFVVVYVSSVQLEQANDGEKHRKKPSGHLSCTSYYTPCAIDCRANYPEPACNFQAFVNVINNPINVEQIFSIVDPNVTALIDDQPNYGACAIIDDILESASLGLIYEINYLNVTTQNNHLALGYFQLSIFDSESNFLETFGGEIIWVKNVCDNWVMNFMNAWNHVAH